MMIMQSPMQWRYSTPLGKLCSAVKDSILRNILKRLRNQLDCCHKITLPWNFFHQNVGNELISITAARNSFESEINIDVFSLVHNVFSGAVHFIASINDSGVREYDMERYQLCKHFRFDWPVNVSSVIHIVIYVSWYSVLYLEPYFYIIISNKLRLFFVFMKWFHKPNLICIN